MKILNSTPDPSKAFAHVISNCGTQFINGAYLTIKKAPIETAAQVLISNFPAWDREVHPSFLYVCHYGLDGAKILEEFYEAVEDFPNDFGEYLICPKCGSAMIRIKENK